MTEVKLKGTIRIKNKVKDLDEQRRSDPSLIKNKSSTNLECNALGETFTYFLEKSEGWEESCQDQSYAS